MMITWVRLVGVLLMTDRLLAENPCDVLGRTDLLHIDGHCFYISPPEDKMDFEGAKHDCPNAIRRGRMAVPHSFNIRGYLFSVAKERELRWVGMQPISNWIERNSVKWVDNSSAQDVFDASDSYGMAVAKPTQEEPLCLALGKRFSLIMKCKNTIGYICESELSVPLSGKDTPPTTLGLTPRKDWPSPHVSHITTGVTTPSGRETYKGNSIPRWLVILSCAVAACLVVGITVVICMCRRRRRRRGSREDKCKENSLMATKSESPHHESPDTQNPMLATEEHTYKGHLYEIPRLQDPTQSKTKGGRECSSISRLTQTQGHGQLKSALTCDVYAEVNLEEKHKGKLDASGAQNDVSDDEYSTALVENTIYGQ